MSAQIDPAQAGNISKFKISSNLDENSIDLSAGVVDYRYYESVLSNNDEIEESPPVKTIIIDTKKGSSKMVSDSNLEINEFEDDEASDSDDESNLRKKVYNKYSKKRYYSFFTDN